MGTFRSLVGLTIALLFLGFGLVRVGVGGTMVAQTMGLIDLPDLADALSETSELIDARKDRQLLPFSVLGYFFYIVAMGAVLSSGATGVIARKKWGQYLIAIYLALHAALFVNFQEINPKIGVLGVTVIMLAALVWLRPPEPVGWVEPSQ